MDNRFEQILVASLGKWGTARCVASSPEAAQGLVLNQFGKELHILAMQRILTHLSWAIFPELSVLIYLSWDISHELSFLSHLSWSIFPELSILSSCAIFPYYLSLLSFLRYLFYSCNSPESLHDGFLHPNPMKPCASVELLFQCVHIASKVEPIQQVMIRYHRSICILRVSHFNWNIFRSPKEGQYQQR